MKYLALRPFILAVFIFGIYIPTLGQSDAEEFYDKARVNFYEGENFLALENINQSLSIEESPEAFYLQAMIFEGLGDEMKSINSLTNVLQLNQHHLDAYFKRGEMFYRKGIYNQALSDFNFVLDFKEGENTQAIYFRIDPNGEEQMRMSTLNMMRAMIYNLKGLTLQAMGEYSKAEENFNESIRNDSSAQFLVNRALLYKELNQSALAINDLVAATAMAPNLTLGWYNLMILKPETKIPDHILDESDFLPMLSYQAVEALQGKDYPKATILLSKALEINPDDPLLHQNSGRLFHEKGQYHQAIEEYKLVLEKNASKFENYYLIGNSFFKLGEFIQSAAYYEQYLARDQSNEIVWFNAAMSYFELDDDDRGCECLENAAERGYQSSNLNSLLGKCSEF